MRTLLLLLLAACGGDKSSQPGDSGAAPVDLAALADTLGAPGPWATVGQRELETTWSEPGIATDRAIDVTVWYPSAEGLVLNAVDDAPLAEGPFRVAIWSHGHQAFATAASHLCSHLASHGWIVVSPTHTDNTLLDGDDRQMAIYAQRPRDVSAALDVVLADGTLGAAADTAPGILGMGHSFGGYGIMATAGAPHDPARLAACEGDGDGSGFCTNATPELSAALAAGYRDPRLTALVVMAAGDADLLGEAGIAAVDLPVLLMSGEYDPKDLSLYWGPLDGPDDRWVDLKGAAHNAFTDTPAFIPPGEPVPPEGALLPNEEVWRLIDIYVGAFADTHTGGATYRALLDGTPFDEAVTLTLE